MDEKMKVEATITVTQDDIKKGTPCSGVWCPIALALRRAFPKAHFLSISSQYANMRMNLQDPVLTAPLPDEASDFIALFDQCQVVKPTSFKLTFIK